MVVNHAKVQISVMSVNQVCLRIKRATMVLLLLIAMINVPLELCLTFHQLSQIMSSQVMPLLSLLLKSPTTRS